MKYTGDFMKKLLALTLTMLFFLSLMAHPKFTPVNTGINYNNYDRADSLHGFDVQSYDIWISINPTAHSISGKVIASVRAAQNLTNIQYELESLTVDSVYVNNTPVTFTHTNGKITIPLSVQNNELFTTRVVYHGNPALSNDGYSNGMTFLTQQVFTVSDPNAARYWWPCYDHPWDKALVNEHIRIRSDWKVACNGLRQSIETHNDNTSTHHWIGSNPMTTYLVSMAAADYQEIAGTFNNIPLQNFVFQSHYNTAQTMFNKLPEMMQVYSDSYGTYPFEKYGNAVASIASFAAMEHQTMTTIGTSLINGSLSSDYTVAHELSHQWFGNCLTPLTWKDVWLSESFATYSEALYANRKFGYDAFCSYVKTSFHDYYKSFAQSNGDRIIYNPAYLEYFYPMEYEKGASVLHMLRALVGNDCFFEILQTYFFTYHNQNVVTSEFIQIAETVSGLDLDQFFTQWIYKKGMPSLDYTVFKSQDNTALLAYVKTSSSEENNPFFLKIPLRFVKSNGVIDSMLVSADPQGAQTLISSSQTINSYALDPKNWILCLDKNENLPILVNTFASSGRVMLNWNTLSTWMENITYNVYRSNSPEGQYLKINSENITGLSYTDPNLTNGQTYYYKIKAVALNEYESEFSNQLTATPIAFPLNQGLLVVDETRDATGTTMNPTDQMVDDFYNQVIDLDYTSWDCATQGLPDLNTIKNFSTIVWHDDDTLLSSLNDETINNLCSYLIAGGKLYLGGWKTMNKLNQTFMNTFCNGIQYYQLNTPIFNSAVSNSFPLLETNDDLILNNWSGNLNYVYVFSESENAIYNAQLSSDSPYQNAPVMVKYNNLVLSGFPLYYMQPSQVHAFFSQLLNDWGVPNEDIIVTSPQKFNFNIYPNPVNSNDNVNIKLNNLTSEQSELAVYNIKGQLVKKANYSNLNKNNTNLVWDKTDVTGKHVSAGIYFIKIKNNNNTLIRKCLIIK